MKEKSNKQFMILSAFGIFFVIDLHAGLPFNVFGDIFDYESYFMQMFVFISGYFFSEKNLKTPLRYILRNTRKLIIPYFLINAFYAAFIIIAKIHNPKINWYYRFSILSEGNDTVFTLPAWFVPMLYFVIVFYVLLRLTFKSWNSIIAFFIFVIMGMASVYLSKSEFNTQSTVLILKIAFFLQFFELGVLYKSRLEKYFKQTSKLKLVFFCILINIVLIIISGNNMKCKYLYKMGGFLTDIYFLPVITSITGICFWLCITEWIMPVLGKSRIINYISMNTYMIMFNHIMFFTLLSYIFSKIPIINAGFDYRQFYENAGWYKFEAFEDVRFLYVIFGLVGCLLLCIVWDKIKEFFRIKQKINKE